MRTYDAPGVYYERTDAASPGIQPLRTDIAGFVGIAERGPLRVPVPVESWRQFEAWFGGFTGTGYLAYAVRAFFENGGRRCWIVRVASDAAATAGLSLDARTPAKAKTAATWLRIEANSPGVWGDDLEVTIGATHRAQTKTLPAETRAQEAKVELTAGFGHRGLIRFMQTGTLPTYRVIDEVDADHSRLSWSNPVAGFDLNEPISIESVEYTLLVRSAGKLLRAYEGLSLVPGHPRYGPDVLPLLSELFRRRRSDALPAAPEPIAIIQPQDAESIVPIFPLDLGDSHQWVAFLRGGGDGLAALRTIDFTGEEVAPDDSDAIRKRKEIGITALNTVDEIAIVAVPDIHIRPFVPPPTAPLPPCVPDLCLPSAADLPATPRARSLGDAPPIFSDGEVFAVQSYLIHQCEKLRDRFAILDAPYSAAKNDKLGSAAIRQWRARFDSTYAALYYPWLKIVDPLRNAGSLTREIPPSGHVAGVFARGDLAIGVHKAPANTELAWAEDLTAHVNEAEHGLMNPMGINALRHFPGRGIRVYGARTVSSDSDWRFINVRRLLMMIEEAIDRALQWVVFEPNDHITRTKVTLVLRNFLGSLWRRGALMGPTQDDAFFVKCTDANNPPSERANGRLLAEVGVAASQPFEFIVLRVGRIDNALEIAEAGTLAMNGRQ